MNPSFDTIDDYIQSFPQNVQEPLLQLLAIIRERAPGAEETFRYGMPAFRTNGKPLLYFAAFPKHIGLYATPTAHVAFAEALAGYTHGKGSVQFPLNQPLPLELIGQMVEFRVVENLTIKKK